MWVSDRIDKKIYAYNMITKERDEDKDFNTLNDAGNKSPSGIWSDGTTMWVVDNFSQEFYAYNMSDKEHDADKTFSSDAAIPYGIWSDGTTMWNSHHIFDALTLNAYAEVTENGKTTWSRAADNDLTLINENANPIGIWSNETTMWVADYIDGKAYAYDLNPYAYNSSKNFETLRGTGNNAFIDLWSDGTTMWVMSDKDDKIYIYDLATQARP